eukprot:3713265-Pyramimonas_sp.AAC.1
MNILAPCKQRDGYMQVGRLQLVLLLVLVIIILVIIVFLLFLLLHYRLPRRCRCNQSTQKYAKVRRVSAQMIVARGMSA